MKKTCAAVLAIGMAIFCAGGCQEGQVSSDVKQSRLIAAENRDLKAQFQQETKKRDDEIKNLNTRLQTETKKRDDEIKNLKSQSQAEAKKQDDEIKKLSEQLKKAQSLPRAEITKRDDEIKGLNAEIERRDGDIRDAGKQLEECEHARDERVAKIIDKQCEETVSKLLDWTAELSAEIERLKAGQADVNKGDTDK